MTNNASDRSRLHAIAVSVMRARGLDPDFPQAALAEVAALTGPRQSSYEPTRDLRSLLWCSIDNDDSRDLDQLSVAEPQANGPQGDIGDVKLLVAIADVDAIVARQSAVDGHAARNTTSVYTPAAIFPMLPERLSTDLTSLNAHQDRVSVVIEFVVSPSGELKASDVYGAVVRNQAKLAYNSVGAWLAGSGPLPPAAAAIRGMDEQLRIQDRVAQTLDKVRHAQGALEFETIEVRHVFDGDALSDLTPDLPNRAKSLIENLMVASNGVIARFLDRKGFPSLRRVVRSPERWDRIRALAAQLGEKLPADADAVALGAFLAKRKKAAPDTFADLSHAIIKLLGRGEYVVDPPGPGNDAAPGHFALAVRDYTHSTAPNRRYPDLVTQRLVKAVLAGRPSPYTIVELEQIAAQCTRQEDNANRVERQLRKSAAALIVERRVGETFAAVVSGVADKGTFVRTAPPSIEGMLVRGGGGVDVGDRLNVRLVSVDVDRGFIDFERV